MRLRRDSAMHIPYLQSEAGFQQTLPPSPAVFLWLGL
jgi:hypothetical protein